MRLSQQKRFRLGQIDKTAFSMDTPFLAWFAGYYTRGQASSKVLKGEDLATQKLDFIMGVQAAKRFSIGADADGAVALGVCKDEADVVMPLDWTSAAFLRKVEGQDWVVLHTPDARVAGARAVTPVAARLWLPVSNSLLDAWLDHPKRPDHLHLVMAEIYKGEPRPLEGEPLARLPLSFRGNWDGDPAALPSPT